MKLRHLPICLLLAWPALAQDISTDEPARAAQAVSTTSIASPTGSEIQPADSPAAAQQKDAAKKDEPAAAAQPAAPAAPTQQAVIPSTTTAPAPAESETKTPAAAPAQAHADEKEPRPAAAPVAPGAPPPTTTASAEAAASTQAAANGEKASARKEPEADPDIAASTAISTGPALRAVHLTAWVAGSTKSRRAFLEKLDASVINCVVVPLKETDGNIYIPGVAKASEYGTYEAAIPDPETMLKDFKARGLRAIARIVVFKDDALARKRPQWAVRNVNGGLWRNQKGIAWVDPYIKPIWDYNLDLADRAVALGFDEIQFDYIRFPSDGNTRLCRYSNPHHTQSSAANNLVEFLRHARQRLGAKPISIAVFGMTTTAKDDMGIGQEIARFAPYVDYISPMMYPSHYGKGEYGLSNPNKEPYKVIFRGLRDAKARLKDQAPKLRPYLQDFSLHGVHYGPQQVKAQVLGAHLQGIEDWILWSPGNKYTWAVLTRPGLGLPPQ
ncbi:MAG: putative glycoside hydrolase [Elusimicrobiota bacterium]|jgi:hypothetical protein